MLIRGSNRYEISPEQFIAPYQRWTFFNYQA